MTHETLVSKLSDLCENHGIMGLKAEFEAEGSRMEDCYRLRNLTTKFNLRFALKIGGCDAVRDFRDALEIGADIVIAPMIESPFALSKYRNLIEKHYSHDSEVQFFFNVETIQGYRNLPEILDLAADSRITGVVIGRTDLTASMRHQSDEVDSLEVKDIVADIVHKVRAKHLICGMGGGITPNSKRFIESIDNRLNYFETRKVMFDRSEIDRKYRQGVMKALEFELEWLKMKRDRYAVISNEDRARIRSLENRMNKEDHKVWQ